MIIESPARAKLNAAALRKTQEALLPLAVNAEESVRQLFGDALGVLCVAVHATGEASGDLLAFLAAPREDDEAVLSVYVAAGDSDDTLPWQRQQLRTYGAAALVRCAGGFELLSEAQAAILQRTALALCDEV